MEKIVKIRVANIFGGCCVEKTKIIAKKYPNWVFLGEHKLSEANSSEMEHLPSEANASEKNALPVEGSAFLWSY